MTGSHLFARPLSTNSIRANVVGGIKLCIWPSRNHDGFIFLFLDCEFIRRSPRINKGASAGSYGCTSYRHSAFQKFFEAFRIFTLQSIERSARRCQHCDASFSRSFQLILLSLLCRLRDNLLSLLFAMFSGKFVNHLIVFFFLHVAHREGVILLVAASQDCSDYADGNYLNKIHCEFSCDGVCFPNIITYTSQEAA